MIDYKPTSKIDGLFDSKVSWTVIRELNIWLSALTIVLMLSFFYWQFFSDPFLKYYDMPFKVEADVVHPGSNLSIDVKRCNRQSIVRAYSSTRELLNVDTGELTIIPAAIVSVAPGCTIVVSKLTTVPADTKPGNYRLQGTAEINDFMTVRLLNWYTTTFKVE